MRISFAPSGQKVFPILDPAVPLPGGLERGFEFRAPYRGGARNSNPPPQDGRP